jgi:hypothetical protein
MRSIGRLPNAVNFDPALRMIRTRDFRAWHGLPADCTPARVAEELRRSNPNDGARQLGTDAIDVEWWPAEVAGYREPLEIQIANGMVVRIDGVGPDLAAGLRAHLEALGKPGAKLPFWDDETKIEAGELVWPERGIATDWASYHSRHPRGKSRRADALKETCRSPFLAR